MNPATLTRDSIAERLEYDTPLFARNCLFIVNKQRKLVPLTATAGQLALDAKLEEQRLAGKPQRAIALKARQVGVSTWVQGKFIHRASRRGNFDVTTLAHDLKTGNKLFRMGERMYENLPAEIRPGLGSTRRGREMHFVNPGSKPRWPDSTYLVDTANEAEAGRGGTEMGIHGSEVAFWAELRRKLAALANAVPDEPESIIVLESTANGANEFKEEWDDAVAGVSDYVAFFWPWWKEEQYVLPFANEYERERFRVGDTDQSPFASGETELYDPGPIDIDTNQHVPLTLEQLNWRRWTIANKCGRDISVFHQEYPSHPDEAFVASGRKVFDPEHVARVVLRTALTDPSTPTAETPGPLRGKLVATGYTERKTPGGDTIRIPEGAMWVPSSKLKIGEAPDWRLWLPSLEIPPDRQYVIGVDTSGGDENEGGDGDPAWHAIAVIEHVSRKQVAEWRSRINPDLVAEQVYLACLLFNMPWCAPESTGSWGMPILRKMWTDGYRYPFLYRRKQVGRKTAKTEAKLGFDTNKQTKPIMIANTAAAIREETDGVQSRVLAGEMSTYVRDENGKEKPEPRRFSDLLMAWQIANYVADEKPLKLPTSTQDGGRQVRNPVVGW